jgi:hypothetical protein
VGREVSGTAPELLRYRVYGGPVRVDQRLILFEDGSGELDERHRSRNPIRIEAASREVERIRELLGALTDRRGGVGEWLRQRVSPVEGHRFRLTWEGHKVTAPDPDDPALAELLTLLDELRLRAIRSQPR